MKQPIKIKCPTCDTYNTRIWSTVKTKYGTRRLILCKDCRQKFSNKEVLSQKELLSRDQVYSPQPSEVFRMSDLAQEMANMLRKATVGNLTAVEELHSLKVIEEWEALKKKLT
jgi:transcriptional regulator NrdR family protein